MNRYAIYFANCFEPLLIVVIFLWKIMLRATPFQSPEKKNHPVI